MPIEKKILILGCATSTFSSQAVCMLDFWIWLEILSSSFQPTLRPRVFLQNLACNSKKTLMLRMNWFNNLLIYYKKACYKKNCFLKFERPVKYANPALTDSMMQVKHFWKRCNLTLHSLIGQAYDVEINLNHALWPRVKHSLSTSRDTMKTYYLPNYK